jgi:hypothetical protein
MPNKKRKGTPQKTATQKWALDDSPFEIMEPAAPTNNDHGSPIPSPSWSDSKKLDFLVQKMSAIDLLIQRVNDLEIKLLASEQKTTALEEQNLHLQALIDQQEDRLRTLETKTDELEEYAPDYSVVAFGVKTTTGEETTAKMKEIFSEGLNIDPNSIIRAKRLKPRKPGQEGLVIAQMRSVEEKIQALRKKKDLAKYEKHGKIGLSGAKSHTDRLLHLNFKTILKEMPNGNAYFVANNGRVIPSRDTQREGTSA